MNESFLNQKGLYFSSIQAAERLGVSIASIRRWNDSGKLKGGRTPGGHRRFSVEELDRFAAEMSSPKEKT